MVHLIERLIIAIIDMGCERIIDLPNIRWGWQSHKKYVYPINRGANRQNQSEQYKKPHPEDSCADWANDLLFIA
jgi:hypothetical protein